MYEEELSLNLLIERWVLDKFQYYSETDHNLMDILSRLNKAKEDLASKNLWQWCRNHARDFYVIMY